jgi:heme/copper-type cytochrome/quinol oxidase subunit 1
MDIVTIAYNLNSVLFGIAFIPQILSLIRDSAASRSMSLSTWGLFSACALISLLYSVLHNGDVYFIVCSGIGAFGNMSVLVLGILRRLRTRT